MTPFCACAFLCNTVLFIAFFTKVKNHKSTLLKEHKRTFLENTLCLQREQLEGKCVFKRSLKNSTVGVSDCHCSSVPIMSVMGVGCLLNTY